MVPVDYCRSSSIVDKVQAGHIGGICELLTSRIQKAAVAFASAETETLADHATQVAPIIQVILSIGRRFNVRWRLRHDLPPKETSQVLGRFLCDVTVGDNQILPAIIVDVGEL